MATLDLATLTRPISETDPCGPDLDLDMDKDYMDFTATIETILPPGYMVVEQGTRMPFDQSERYKIDFDTQFAKIGKLVSRTHDLRLLATIARMQALCRDLAGFETCIAAISTILSQFWEAVHPRDTGDRFEFRESVLGSLNDKSLILPALQQVRLFSNKRYGAITYFRYLASTGVIKTATDKIDLSEMERILADEKETELPVLVATRDRLDGIQRSLTSIRTVFFDKSGRMLNFDDLLALVEHMRAPLQAVIVKRDPTAGGEAEAPAPEEEVADAGEASTPPAKVAGGIATPEAAVDALAAATDYFRRTEPSNPGLLLLWQAQALVGKSFVDAVQLLVPAQVQKAALRIGADTLFDLPIEKLAALAPKTPVAAADKPTGETPAEKPVARTRREANALLEQVAAFYRTSEPSSAIPLLADRARTFSGKDFMALLAEVLPKKP
jgi:type VI secretion system protein ImpA